MSFNRITQADTPIMKSKAERLSEFKWSVIRTVLYIVVFMLLDMTLMSPRVDNVMIVWLVRIMYSLTFVVSLHTNRVIYRIYQLENELREYPVHSDETSK